MLSFNKSALQVNTNWNVDCHLTVFKGHFILYVAVHDTQALNGGWGTNLVEGPLKSHLARSQLK